MKSVSVLAPATVANIVCGFDVMGFALNAPYDEFTVSVSQQPGVTITHTDAYNLPLSATQNVSGVALLAMLKSCTDVAGFTVQCHKNIKPGSGIGSSAASAAGVVVAANHLLGNRFSKTELVEFAMCGEEVASGSKHADNIAPAIFGGFTLIRSSQPLDVISIPNPHLYVTILHPQIEIKTSDARKILKQTVLLKTAVKQWGNVAALTAALCLNDYDLLARSLQDDIVEPVRGLLIPKFNELKQSCLQAGALGGGISGSGPSVFMLSKNLQTAKLVEIAMQQVYQQIQVPFHTHVTEVNQAGIKIM